MPDATVVWLPEAITELDEILEYIAERNVLAALAVNDRIAQQIGQLVAFPFLGRKGRIDHSFELVISRTPYLVAYRLPGDQVQILHVFHERRSWPSAQ